MLAKFRESFRTYWILLAIIAVGATLRFYGINYGLPYTYAPDEPTYLEIMLRMIRTGDLNPHWWLYPSLMFYLSAIPLAGWYLIGQLSGRFTTPLDLTMPQVITIGVGKLALPEELLITRGTVIIFSVMSIILVYLIARRLYPNPWFARLATAFFAVSTTVVVISHRSGPDIFVLFFVLVSVYFSLRSVDEPSWRHYIGAGIGAGLAIGAKYNAAPILIPLLVVLGFKFGRTGFKRVEVYATLGSAIGAFFISSPFVLIDFQGFVDGVRWQVFSYAVEGHVGQEGDALRWYVEYLWKSEGWIAVLGALSMFGAIMTRSKRWLVLVSFPLVYFAFVSLLYTRNDRTILLVVPFLDLVAAWGLIRGGEWLIATYSIKRLFVIGASIIIGATMIIPLVQSAIAFDVDLLKADSRETARVWIEQNLPPGARLFIEPYSPYVDPDRFMVDAGGAIDHPMDWYIQNGIEYLVFSYGTYGRFFENRAFYSETANLYNEYFARFSQVARFNDGGYEIRIFKTGVSDLPSNRVAARFGIYSNWLELVGYDVKPSVERQPIDATFYWRVLEPRREPLSLTVRLLDRNDHEVAQSTGALFGNERPTSGIVRVPWTLGATDEPGLYRLEVDVDAEGQGRIPVLSRTYEKISDKLFVGPIKVSPATISSDELQKMRAINTRFGDAITLLGYARPYQTVAACKNIEMTFYWQSSATLEKDYTIFLHLIDSSGKVIAQLDRQPRDGAYPSSIWNAGEIVRDDYALALACDVAPGDYRIELGMYEYPNLNRLRVTTMSGTDLSDHLLLDDVIKVTR